MRASSGSFASSLTGARRDVRQAGAARAPAQLLELACPSTSSASRRPLPPMRRRDRQRLAARAAHASTTRPPGGGATSSATSWLPSSSTSNRPSRNADRPNAFTRVSRIKPGRRQRRRPRDHVLLGQRARQRLAGDLDGVHPHRHRRALVHRRAQPPAPRRPEIVDQPLDQPGRVRQPHRLALEPGARAQARVLVGDAAEIDARAEAAARAAGPAARARRSAASTGMPSRSS